MRLIHIPLISNINDHIIDYPTPSNISYWWGFGSLAGFCLTVQLITGIFLAMHYTPHVDLAFYSVEHITRDVNNGWLLRYLHANGASMFFIVVYLHIGRGIYYCSYIAPREKVWFSGIGLFFLMMATGFMGYVLPWGMMSYWGATVITNLFSAIPLVGQEIAYWLWGGFSVDNATLNRFFSIHYLLPFIIAGLSLVHLVLLHNPGSNNPLGIQEITDKIPFYPYFYVKDVFGLILFMIFFGYYVFFNPNLLGHPDNYIEANALVTPAHIVPEWYFLSYYAILRSIPNKLGGVILMGLSIAILAVLPFNHMSKIRSPRFKPLYAFFTWIFFIDFFLLMWLGGKPVEEPYVTLSLCLTIYYFIHFLIIVPFLGWLEHKLIQLNYEDK